MYVFTVCAEWVDQLCSDRFSVTNDGKERNGRRTIQCVEGSGRKKAECGRKMEVARKGGNEESTGVWRVFSSWH